MSDPRQCRLIANRFGDDSQRAELIECPRKDLVAGLLVDGKTFTRERTLVDHRRTCDDVTVNRNPLTGPHGDDVTDDDIGERDVLLTTVALPMHDLGPQCEGLLHRPPRTIDGISLDTFPDQRDQDDQPRRLMLTQGDRGEARERERQVRTKSPRQQAIEGMVQDAGTTQHRRQKCQPIAPECCGVGPAGGHAPCAKTQVPVGDQKCRHDQCQEIERGGLIMKVRLRRDAAGRVTSQHLGR